MTTAHRPTFDPAQGKEALRGPAYHQRLLPAHTYLKVRQQGQGGAADARPRDFRAELLEAEAAAKASRDGGSVPDDDAAAAGQKRKAIAGGEAADEDADSETAGDDAEGKRRRLILEEAADIDADESSDSASSSDESEEDESDDEDAALQREMDKIKAEKAAKKAAEDAERAQQEEDERVVEIARGNPLLNGPQFGVARAWNDDAVFKHQARGTEDKGKRREFVNDLLRSDFHKKFMSKYVR